MIGTNGAREFGKSLQAARRDDDNISGVKVIVTASRGYFSKFDT